MRCKNCQTKLKPGAAFCPKCGTPVTKGKGIALPDKQKKMFFLAGGVVLLALVIGGVLIAVQSKKTAQETFWVDQQDLTGGGSQENGQTAYPVVTQESIAAGQNQEPAELFTFDLEAMDHQPAEKHSGMEWDSDLFYELEGIHDSGVRGIGTLSSCILSQYCLKETSTNEEIQYEVYSDPDSGKIYKITSIREYEGEPVDITDYYYRDGKPYFVLWRQDEVYTPLFASIHTPGMRFYFENDTMVRVRTVLKESLKVSQTTLKPQGRTDYEEFDYFTAPDEIKAQYDAYELEWLNRSYNTYNAIAACEHLGKICGTVTDEDGNPLSGHGVYLQNQDSGEVVCSMQTDENGQFLGYVYQEGKDFQLYIDGMEDYQDLYIHEIHVTQGTYLYEYDPVLIAASAEPATVTIHMKDASIQDSGQETEAGALGGQIIVRKGADTRRGEAVWTFETDAGKDAQVTLPCGNYTIEAVADGYERTWKSMVVTSGLDETTVYLLPTLSEGESAFVLTWREDSGVDLDLTVFTSYIDDDGNMNHIGGNNTEDHVQNYLIRDNAYSCEVIYGSASYGGNPFKVYVCNYTEAQRNETAAAWKDLDIHLYIYQTGGQVTEFRPNENAGGVVWEAAAVRNGSISGYNRYYDNIEGKPWWKEEKGDFLLSKEDKAIFLGIAHRDFDVGKWTPQELIEKWVDNQNDSNIEEIEWIITCIFERDGIVWDSQKNLYEENYDECIEKYVLKGGFEKASRICRELFDYELKPEDFWIDYPGETCDSMVQYNESFNELVYLEAAEGTNQVEDIVSVKYDPEQDNYMVLVNSYVSGYGPWRNDCCSSNIFRLKSTTDNSFGYRILSLESVLLDNEFKDFFEDRITIPYNGENVTYSELYEKEPFGCGCFLADIDNDYQDEIVFVEDSVQRPYLVLDHALDGSIQEMDISEDMFEEMSGALVNVDGETWLAGANVSYPIPIEYAFYKYVGNELVDQIHLKKDCPEDYDGSDEKEYVFYYNNQRITEKQYEAILSKYYNNDTREDLGNLVEKAYR